MCVAVVIRSLLGARGAQVIRPFARAPEGRPALVVASPAWHGPSHRPA